MRYAAVRVLCVLTFVFCAAGAAWIASRGLDNPLNLVSFTVTAACAVCNLVMVVKT